MFSFRDEYVCNDVVKHSFIHSFMCVMLSLFQPGNRMFSFRDENVDFYLPQLLNMYIQMHDVAEAIHPYLVHRSVRVLHL